MSTTSIEYQKGKGPKAVSDHLKKVGRVLPKSLLQAVKWSTLSIVRHVTKNKMRGQVINRITGTAIRSVTASPRFEAFPTGARGFLGSNLGYVRALNEGFTGEVPVKAHVRKLRITRDPTSGRKFRRSKKTGRLPADRAVRMAVKVRAHTRNVDIRGRKFFQDAFAEKTPDVKRAAIKAIHITLMTGKVPKRSDLGGT